MKYILLVGVHGVGKTTLTDKIKTKLKINSLSISDLIRQAGNNIKTSEKCTKNISNNQELWKEELKNYSFESTEIVILDGHFTLLNSNKEVVELPFSTFDNVLIGKIILKKERPSIIRDRLQIRDSTIWKEDLIESFQDSETRRVREFAKLKEIPLFEFESDNQIDDLIKFLELE